MNETKTLTHVHTFWDLELRVVLDVWCPDLWQ